MGTFHQKMKLQQHTMKGISTLRIIVCLTGVALVATTPLYAEEKLPPQPYKRTARAGPPVPDVQGELYSPLVKAQPRGARAYVDPAEPYVAGPPAKGEEEIYMKEEKLPPQPFKRSARDEYAHHTPRGARAFVYPPEPKNAAGQPVRGARAYYSVPREPYSPLFNTLP